MVLFALGGTTFISLKSVQVLSAEVSLLKTALQGSPDIAPLQAQLTTLQQQFEASRMQLGGMADKPAIAALQQKIEALDKQQSEQAASVTALKNGLSSFQEQIRTLNQRPANVAAVVPAVTSGTVVVKKKPIPKAQRPVTAPFVLTGIERRGGIAFAAIAPQSATQLTEIALMEPGETRQGWTLQSITGQQALFRVAGQTRTLTVR
nr:methyl-accepting chemotaxis protein [Edwardsiella ictaluri]